MRGLVVAFVVGLVVPLGLFVASLHVGADRVRSELELRKIGSASAGSVRELTLEELATLPLRLRVGIERALATGVASVPLDADLQHALAALQLHPGTALALDGAILLLQIVEHPGAALADALARPAEQAACWLSARLGGGCAS